MLLDFNPSTHAYIVRLPSSESTLIQELLKDHGFDMSVTASTAREAVLFTHEDYAAVPFWEHCTPAAQAQLLSLHEDIEASWASDSQGHILCPGDQELWPYQKAGVEYAMRQKNTLIGDQPGLGKTPQAICLANEMRARRVLVVCPANIRLQWAKMIRRWSTMDWPYHVYPIIQGKNGVHPEAAWTIVSYDLARSPSIWAALAEGRYDLLIIDEAHYLKTIDTHRTRAVFGGGTAVDIRPLVTRVGATLALTGTPLPNRPREAYTLARGLCFDSIDFASEEAFRLKFNPSLRGVTEDGRVYTDERTGRHGELQSRLRANFMVRREKHGPRGVLPQLKLPDYDLVYVEETGAVKAALKAESMLDIDLEHLPGPADPIMGQIATARRLMGVAIAPLAAEYVEMLLDGGEDKIVLFAHHIEVLDILEERLKRYGTVRIDGRTSAANKQARVNKFIQDPRTCVCLGNLQSMGTGTDGLQEVATHGVLAEPDWVHGTNQQAVDRLDRGGQTGKVQIDLLVAPNSLSERVLAQAIDKGTTVHKALDKRH